jgi:hypothetical protein
MIPVIRMPMMITVIILITVMTLRSFPVEPDLRSPAPFVTIASVLHASYRGEQRSQSQYAK